LESNEVQLEDLIYGDEADDADADEDDEEEEDGDEMDDDFGSDCLLQQSPFWSIPLSLLNEVNRSWNIPMEET
jgi:hypothetical protein